MTWYEWVLAVVIVGGFVGAFVLAYIFRTPRGRPLTEEEIKFEQYKSHADG